jgi:hypothetical protein
MNVNVGSNANTLKKTASSNFSAKNRPPSPPAIKNEDLACSTISFLAEINSKPELERNKSNSVHNGHDGGETLRNQSAVVIDTRLFRPANAEYDFIPFQIGKRVERVEFCDNPVYDRPKVSSAADMALKKDESRARLQLILADKIVREGREKVDKFQLHTTVVKLLGPEESGPFVEAVLWSDSRVPRAKVVKVKEERDIDDGPSKAKEMDVDDRSSKAKESAAELLRRAAVLQSKG